MELIAIGGLLVLMIIVWAWIDSATSTPDNREPYVRDDDGKVWALRVAGPVGDVPNHEAFIHDGTPHQNPAVREYSGWCRILFLFPFPDPREERYYPITDNGNGVNLRAIAQRVNSARLRRRQEVELTTMPRWAEKAAINRENAEQRGRGVTRLEKRGR
jgi:hypothetical protein